MGAGKWRPEYAQASQGRSRSSSSPTRDEPGRNHAETVKEVPRGLASAVYVVQAKKGKDATDHFAAGHKFDGLPGPAEAEGAARGSSPRASWPSRGRRPDLTVADIPGYQLVDAIPLVFRQGRMYAVGAYQGDGKSRFALQGTRKLASEGKRGAYWSLEMPERDVRNALLTHKGIPLSLLEEPWRLRIDSPMYPSTSTASRR
jgi:hypothetical protein